MPENRSNQVMFFVGMKESGKTYTARQVADEWPRVISIDWTGQYRGVVIETGREMARYVRDNLEKPRFRVAFRPTQDEDTETGLRAMFQAGHPDYRTMLVLEEASNYAPPAISKKHPVLRVFRYGRHEWVDVLAISQRPADIHKLATAQADLILAFRTTEPNDLEYLKGRFGKELEPRIKALDQGEFIAWGDPSILPEKVRRFMVATAGAPMEDTAHAEAEPTEGPETEEEARAEEAAGDTPPAATPAEADEDEGTIEF